MAAGVYRDPGGVQVEQVQVPEIGQGEVRVRVHSCGVCGTDIKKIQYRLVEPPRIFGHEIAGVIESTGPGVDGWSTGDRVVVHHHVPCGECWYCRQGAYAQCPTYKRTGTTAGFEPAGGGFAEYIRVMDWVVRRGMVRIPDDVSFEEASFVEPVNTCLKAIRKAGVKEEQSVLVMGQGQIGLLFTQLARIQGAAVFASDLMPSRRTSAERFGAIALNPEIHDVPSEVKARTDGRGADLAIVAVADTSLVAQAFESVRCGGRVMLFAQTRLGDGIQVDAGAVCMLEKDLIGSYSADIDLQQESAELIFSRRLNVRDLITHRFPLSEIQEALDLAAHPREGSLKIMVNP